jgi:hypothetical protein
MDRMTSKFARLKYAGERKHYQDVWKHVYHEILKMGKEQGWKFEHEVGPKKYRRSAKGFVAKLAELSLQESVGSDRCRRCNGRGTIHTGYKTMDCFSCEGSGVLKKTEAYRAKFMGLGKTRWHMSWKYRFRQHILGIFDVFEYEISKELDRRL